jgi:hypothetical protein
MYPFSRFMFYAACVGAPALLVCAWHPDSHCTEGVRLFIFILVVLVLAMSGNQATEDTIKYGRK